MYQWLKNYVYHTDLSPLIFLLALVISVFIAILTVSYQTIKAASRNPVDALKFE
jgi:ABC-type antimicrobial peptide transport system permease subunit